ncbi:MAG: diguanylate cyclase [Pseudomonas sp.]|uniref:diguanylate cyclase domain-containing protein n=1 Tax=Pseudomonas sp. TaxID=306 RepID=UPI00339482C7
MLKRLKDDFQLSIITFMGVFAILGISPYAIYRLLQGNVLVGVTDSILVACTLAAVVFAWRTGDTRRAGMGLAIIVSFGAALVAINLGVNGLFWIYVVVLFNFFMIPPGKAMLLTLSLLGSVSAYALLSGSPAFPSQYQSLSFLVTSLTASGFAFVFAFRMRRQRDQLQMQATLDPLTGTGNRRSMDHHLLGAVAGKRRHHQKYGVLMMDLDHFKRINDQFGHPAGDRVLVEFAHLVQSLCRQQDHLFRLGGEEFLLLLPMCDAAGLSAAADKLQQALAKELRGPGGPVTVSIGGALLHSDETAENWLKRADEQLYLAKNAGRNRARIDSTTQRSADTSARCP